MKTRSARLSLPLSAQIVVLLLGVLVVAQVVTLFFTLLAPPAPAPQYRLQDVAASLRGQDVAGHGARPLIRSVRKDPPSLNSAGWMVSERSRRELAALLGTDEANVRLLFYSPLPFAGTDPGGRAQIDLPASGPAWSRVPAGGAPSREGLTTVRYMMQAGPGQGGDFGHGGGGGFGGPPGRDAAQGRPGRDGPPSSTGRGPSHAWNEAPATGTRIRTYSPPQSAPSQSAPSRPGPPATMRPGSQEQGPGGAPTGPNSFTPPAAAPSGASATGTPGGAQGQPFTGPNPVNGSNGAGNFGGLGGQGQTQGLGQGLNQTGGLLPGGAQGVGQGGGQGFGQGLGQNGGLSPGGAQGVGPGLGQGPSPNLGHGSGFSGGPVSGPSLGGGPISGVPAQGRAPSIGQPAAPHEEIAQTRTAAPAEAFSPRPLKLATTPQVALPVDLGLIAPAPMVAAQNGDDAGWTVGTPQEPARGLFGFAPSPFVQGDFVAAVRNAANEWITVSPQAEPFPNAWQRRVIWWFVAAFAVVGPVGYLFAQRLARPIDRFAAAAERLGRDPTAPLAPLGGPAEIGRAAQAFNQMHNRLRRFVEDRTSMVGAISHDLRTPLTRMRFRLERVPPDVRSGMLTDIQQMEEMISSVLVFIRDAAEPATRERIDLRSLVECVVDDAALIGGEAVLDPGDPLSVDVDALGVQRVLTNLIDNALKYGVRADVRLYHDGGDAVAEVSDAGPGLPPEEIERVFLPFYRADHARGLNKGGIGLGLALSRSIARAHGGDVRLTSDGKGLTAQLRLPLSSRAA